MKKALMRQRDKAYEKNKENILFLLDVDSDAKLLDLGCDDGEWTMQLAEKIGTENIFGYEIIDEAAKKAESKGIKVKRGDLNRDLRYGKESFDVIHANQVIEHLNDTDKFLSEIYRVLKPGGYAVISTENLASWHNIFSLVLGFMPFSLTNISSQTGAVGNPLAPHTGEDFWRENSWQHQRIFTINGIRHLSTLHGFAFEWVLSAGYYPFGNLFSNIDPNHSAFMAVKIRKEELPVKLLS
jgi:2-polyprenyl-3-methyl-5-hydroxy-6-metoxy-1,4-benzoquinol methylase